MRKENITEIDKKNFFRFTSRPLLNITLHDFNSLYFIGFSGPAALRLSAFGAKVMAAMAYKYVSLLTTYFSLFCFVLFSVFFYLSKLLFFCFSTFSLYVFLF